MRLYAIDYSYDGARWTIEIAANSPEEAMDRLHRASAFGSVTTPHGIDMRIPGVPGAGVFVRLLSWFRNVRGG